MSGATILKFPERRKTKVLCSFRYFVREGNSTRSIYDGIVIEVFASWQIRAEFTRELNRRFGNMVSRGYEFLRYSPENSERDF